MGDHPAGGAAGGDSEDGQSGDPRRPDRFGRRLAIWQIAIVPISVAFLGLVGVIIPVLAARDGSTDRSAPTVPAPASAASSSRAARPSAEPDDAHATSGGACKASLAGVPKDSDGSIDIEVAYECPLATGRHRWIVIELEDQGNPPHSEYYFKDEVVGPGPQRFNYRQEPYRQIFYTVVLTSAQNDKMRKIRLGDGLTLSLHGGTREADPFVHPA